MVAMMLFGVVVGQVLLVKRLRLRESARIWADLRLFWFSGNAALRQVMVGGTGDE